MHYFYQQLVSAAKSAVRNFQKNRLYGSLNILGLSISFCTVILVMAYLYQETNYESFHSKADRIYRPTHHIKTQQDFEVHFARIPVDYINQLPDELPEVEKLIRFQNKEQKHIRIGEKRFKPKYAFLTDRDVFEVFDFPLIEGDPETALANPYTVVLTESIARKYYGRTNVVGETMIVTGDWSDEEKEYKVTGVMQDLPVNTHLPVDLLFSFASPEERSGWAYIYTLLAEGADIASVEAKMPAFIQNHADPESTAKVEFAFQPLPGIHLHSNLAREIKPNGQVLYVRIFFWVGLLVWIIALVNFANLSTALAMGRGREAGVRRILGASKANLILFSLSESVIYSMVAMAAGGTLAWLLFPAFSDLTGIVILPPLPYSIGLLLGLTLASGILAGILPGMVLISVQALQIIKQGNNWSMRRAGRQLNVRQGLIAIQFCAAVILIGSALVAHRQFAFIRTKNLGLQTEQILAIPEVPGPVVQQYTVFKNRIKKVPGVRQVSACMQMPSSEIRDTGPVLIKGKNDDVSAAPMTDVQIIDPDFISMMDIRFVAGEDFSKKVALRPFPEFNENLQPGDYLASTPRKYLINETAMRHLGWQNASEAIGQEINWSIGNYNLAYGPITGVIEDYHQESLKNKVDPLVLTIEPIWLSNFLVKVETGDLEKTIAGIKQVWNEMFPYAMEYTFLDEMFNRLYQQDRVQLELLSMLAFIAIFIAFLGLISLVAYALKRRSKELAIRRVIGADLRSLTFLMGKEYFWILAVAVAAGIPVSYYWVADWLQHFAYHVEISPAVYARTIVVVYALLLVTIYLQTLRATREHPVEALREE